MPSRQQKMLGSEVLPISEDSFVIDLREADNNRLQLSLKSLVLNETNVKDAERPVIYEHMIAVEATTFTSPLITADPEPDKSAVPFISLLEVGQHDSFDDCWVVIYDRVYDITHFLHSVSRRSRTRNLYLAIAKS